MLQFLQQKESTTIRKPRSLSRTEITQDKLMRFRMNSNNTEQQDSCRQTLRHSNSKRKSLSRGLKSAGFFSHYEKFRPMTSKESRELQKPLMEKNYNEDIIRRKMLQKEQKEAHKIMFLKALSSYKKLTSNHEAEAHKDRPVRTEDDLERKKQAIYKALETNKYRILEDQPQTSKEMRRKLAGRSSVAEAATVDLDRLKREHELKLDEMARRENERREAERRRYEQEERERRHRQRLEYEQEEKRRREQQKKKAQRSVIQPKKEESPQTQKPQGDNKKSTVVDPKRTQQKQQPLEMPEVDISKTKAHMSASSTNHSGSNIAPRTLHEPEIKPAKTTSTAKTQPKSNENATQSQEKSVQFKTFDKPKSPPKAMVPPLPPSHQTEASKRQQQVKKPKQVSKILPKPRDDDDQLESITLEGPSKPPPIAKEPLRQSSNILEKQHSVPPPAQKPPTSKPVENKPQPPPAPQQQLSEQEQYIDEMKQMLNMVGETIGHGSRDLRGIDVGWMIPCYFLYRKFYQLRQDLMKQYMALFKSGQATQQQINELKDENEKVRVSLERMGSVCLKRCTNSMRDKFSQKIELPINDYLYQTVEEYVKEISTKDESLPPEHLLKAKVHLLEILNSLLVVQNFEGYRTKPMGPEQLSSESTRTNIDRLLKVHLAQVRRYTTKHKQ